MLVSGRVQLGRFQVWVVEKFHERGSEEFSKTLQRYFMRRYSRFSVMLSSLGNNVIVGDISSRENCKVFDHFKFKERVHRDQRTALELHIALAASKFLGKTVIVHHHSYHYHRTLWTISSSSSFIIVETRVTVPSLRQDIWAGRVYQCSVVGAFLLIISLLPSRVFLLLDGMLVQ